MHKPLVYLAGPIAGLTYKAATEWRHEAADMLAAAGITCLNPMRGKSFLASEAVIEALGYEKSMMATNQAIMSRDHFDCCRSDLVLANLTPDSKSLGTAMELAWAYHLHKPVVAVMGKDSAYEHAMVLEAVKFRCHSVSAAVAIARSILLP